MFTPQPSWQANFAGITVGSNRTVPDIALDASPNNAGYLICSSDSNATGVNGSCSNGFHGANNSDQDLTFAGGTSFAAPIFAGMLAVINQSQNSSGQGVINPTLYGLASNATTYASAFHDITSGSNACTAGPTLCAGAGETEYAAGPGYDEASGLGSIDLDQLLKAWPATAAAAGSALTVTAASETPAPGATDAITITVAPAAGDTVKTIPTGSVEVTVGTVTTSISLVNGAATYTFSNPTVGSYQITVAYPGDSTYAASSVTTSVMVTAPATGPTAGFAVAATSVSVMAGATGTSTVTVTPSGGYTGTVNWGMITAVPTLSNGCYVISSVAVPGTAAVTTTLTVLTNAAQCPTASAAVSGHGRQRFLPGSGGIAEVSAARKTPFGSVPVGVALAGLLTVGFFGRRVRGVRLLMVASLFAVLGLGVSGCGSSMTPQPPGPATQNVAAGVYTLTLTGTDAKNTALTASANVTVTVTAASN